MCQIIPDLDYQEGGSGGGGVGDAPASGQSMAGAGQSIFITS